MTMNVPLKSDPGGLSAADLRAESKRLRKGQRKAMLSGDRKAAAIIERAADVYDAAAAQAGDGTWAIDWDAIGKP